MNPSALILLLTFSTTLCLTSVAQQLSSVGTQKNQLLRPKALASQITRIPTIDGEVLEDSVWQAIPAFGELKQVQPNFGQAASEETAIRIAFSKEHLYVAVVCYDKHPEQLVVSDARRDGSLDDTDAFLFILDTYYDKLNGFVFGTNSIGVEYDAQVDNEGQGNFSANRQQRGIIGGFNLNWDASWTVKTQVGDFGWSAEFAIPLRTLRYRAGKEQTWGINFRRNIRKTNEINYWSLIPIGLDLNRLSLAGTLEGLQLPSPGNLKFIPYVLGQALRDYEDGSDKTDYRAEVGADIKYSISSSLTLDLTYNTDFAQVEVDDQQVNLDRFNLFFPEKRPFFLENAGLFSVGSPGEVDLFFSRRIGIGQNGLQVPIIGGGRLSGKVDNTNIGFLSMFTDQVEEQGITRNNFTVARVNHQFEGRSSLGGAFINRQGIQTESDDYNRTFAVDGRWGIGNKASISGFLAQTQTPGIETDAHAFKLESKYVWDNWEISGAYTEVAEGFNPEVGFLLRSAFRKPEARILYHLRAKESSPMLELRPHISYRSYWNFDNKLITSFLHIDNHWEWKNGFEVHTGINFTTEGVVDPFEISSDIIVPEGSFNHSEAQLVFITNPSKPLSISTRHVLGGFFGGKRYNNSATVVLRLGDKFNTELGWARNDIDLPYGTFSTDIIRSRISYSFTPLIFTQSLIQYNSVADLWSANIRFGLLQQANSGLFVVYNELRGAEGVMNRSFNIKYSHVLDVLR